MSERRPPDCTFQLDLETSHFICKLCGDELASINEALAHARAVHPVTEKEKKSNDNDR